AEERAWNVEHDGLSWTRGVRVRGDPVQLHGHRRQPAHGARVDGLHGHLEAIEHRYPLGVAYDATAPRSGHARWRDQLRARQPGGDHEAAARPPRPWR